MRRIKAICVAAAAAVLLQIGAFFALKNVASESAEFERTLNSLPEKTVVTDVFFLPEQTPHLFFDKDVFQLDRDNADKLTDFLHRDGRRNFILLLSPRFRRVGNEQLARLLNASEVDKPIPFRRTAGSGFMVLHIVRCRLK